MGNATGATTEQYKKESLTSEFIASHITKLSPKYSNYYDKFYTNNINGERIIFFKNSDDAKQCLMDIGLIEWNINICNLL